YFPTLQISEPNEFDIMLVIPVTRLHLEESDDTGAYYYLTFKRNPKEKYLLKYLDEDGKLSGFKMLQALREIIKQEVKNIKSKGNSLTYVRKTKMIAAVLKNRGLSYVNHCCQKHYQKNKNKCFRTVTLAETNSRAYYLLKEMETNREDFFFYSKPEWLCSKTNNKEQKFKGNTWRLSFSHIEKAMMNNHGNGKTCCESDGLKCCRKGCLKLMKYLLEQLKMKHTKELDKISSYHVKTAFFHSCVMWPKDTDWHLGDLDHCFQKYLGYFLGCLEKSHLPHFFIPQYNLLSLEDKASSDFLSRKINYELNNRFPIF
ncbi:CGAS synthase, partial [Sula dactylatra]|nr:CGAS synthase [Sula dactylatra]